MRGHTSKMAESRVPIERVELGFVENPEDPSHLTSSFFPSKVGGKPAWLDQRNLPSPEELACGNCGKPTIFLLQVYAPLPDIGHDNAFHRTVFVFMCRDPRCHQTSDTKCFKVLRCQLSKVNEFYPVVEDSDSNPSSDDEEEEEATSKERQDVDTHLEHLHLQESSSTVDTSQSQTGKDLTVLSKTSHDNTKPTFIGGQPPLCIVCGCMAPKHCGKCKQAHYCSREHQVHDWKSGHRHCCSKIADHKCSASELNYDPGLGVLLPEMEIVTEEEPDADKKPERSEEDRMADYLKYVKSGSCTDGSDGRKFDEKALDKAAFKEDKTDKQFRAFKKRIALEPEQVIRYQKGGQPLLVSAEGGPKENDMPSCSCGVKRVFEFQVMPQLLYYLKMDSISSHSIDWGSLMVYACEYSCPHKDSGYHSEVLWKQNV